MPRFLQSQEPAGGQLELGAVDSPLEAAARRSAGDGGGSSAPDAAGAGSALPPPAAGLVRRATGGSGIPLPRHLRREFEARVGGDLGAVRLHTGGHAGVAAQALGAKAFTLGQHVAFAPGRFAPGTTAGRRLLGHELSHTVQHRRGAAPATLVQRDPDDEWPPQSSLAIGLWGMTFTPQGEATYRAGDRGPQVIAIALRRLIGEAYQPGLERHFYSTYRRRHGDPVLSGRLAGEAAGESVAPFTMRAQPAFALVRWLEDGGAGDVYIALTEEQRDLLALAVGADQAWSALLEAARQLDLAIPAWFNQGIFAAEIASRRRLLRAFMTAQDRYEQQPSAATREARLEAAAEIFRSMQNGLLILEAIREDPSLVPAPDSRDAALVNIAYISLWPATPESAGRAIGDVMLRSAIAGPGDPLNGLSAARFLTYLRTQPALTRDALSSSDARRELLLRYVRFIERSFSPAAPGDQRLSDDPARLASDPPHEAHLSSYPQLQPPFFDAATGTGHKFSMSIHFPTVFDAFATYSYRFDRIRVPDDEFVGAVDESTPGDAPSWGEVYAADMVIASRYLAADVRRGIDRFGQEWGPPGQTLGAAVLVGAMRYVGTSISTLLQILTEPRWEATFVFPEDGLYVVRCNAVRHNREEAEVTRPPSVAYLPVLARNPREMAERRVEAARTAAERERERERELQEMLAQPVTWMDQEALEAEYAALSAAHGDVEDLYGHQRREIARQLALLEAQIIAPYDRDDSRARTLLRIHPLADRAAQLRRQLERIDDILDTRRRRWSEHGITAVAERLTATFVSDQGQVVNLVLEAVDRTPDGVSQPRTYYVADATTPSGSDEQATAATRADAILNALVAMLEEGDGYGRGELVVLIDGQTWHRRIEASSTKLLMEAVEHVATIASIAAIAAAPFTGGASLYLLIPIGIIGAIPSAYRIARRVEDETFRWDLQIVMDFVNIVSAAVGVGQVGAAARVVWLGRSLMVTGFGLDGLNMVLLGAQVIEQIDATRGLPEGERAARISQILGGALFQLGITAAGSLASRRYQQQAEAGRAPDVDVGTPRSDADVDVGTRSTMAGAGWETLPAPPARRAASDLPPPTDPNSPEHLFALLEGGVEPTLPPAGRAPTPAARPRSRSTVQRGIASPREAYRIYNETLAVADGREVAIYYNRDSNEYMVRIGSETDVAAYGAGWVTLVHFHPNPTEGLTFRLPAPADFEGLLHRALSGPVREFVEFDIPGVGRGRTEFGIDLDAPDPIFIRISHPGGETQVIRFRDTGDYTSYWGERTVYVEPGSATHQQMLDNIGAWIRERRGGDIPDPAAPGAGSTMAGLGAWIRARRGRRHSERLRRAGAALPEGPITDQQMLGFLRQADQHPLRQQMRDLAQLQGDHPGPGSPLTMQHVARLLEAFRAETGMQVVVTAEASGVNLRPGEAGRAEGQIRIEESIRSSPEVLFAELSHDINAYLGSRTQRLPLRDMPELASLPGGGGMIDPRDYFHAGRILDYATLRRLSVDDAIAEIGRDPVRALFRLEEWIASVKRRAR